MSNANPSRIGSINGGVDKKALFLKVFSGEVLAAFAEKNVMADKVQVRNITSGKSAQFPLTGKTTATYHVPGTEILGKAIAHAERIINIDDLLISDAFIANIDEAMNHYEVRSIYSTEIGYALANTHDRHLLQLAVLASRDAGGVVTGEPGGGFYQNANVGTTAAELIKGAFAAAQAFDEKDVPEHDRYLILKPAQYNILAQDSNLLSRDYNTANGDYSKNVVLEVAGLKIIKSNHVPSTVISNGSVLAGTNNTYAGDFTTTVGVAIQKSALGTVKLLDLASESEYDIRRQGTLMVSKFAMGHGILRPACAFELRRATPPAFP